MRKVITALAIALAFIFNNEILTMLFLTTGAVILGVFILKAWASKETEKMPGSFDADWGKK